MAHKIQTHNNIDRFIKFEQVRRFKKESQVVWASVARSSFQGRTRGILSSTPRRNNVWPVRMPLRTSRISCPPLVGHKPVRKQKQKNKTQQRKIKGMKPYLVFSG